VKILMVNKFAYVTGGADRYCLAVTHALRERGHDVRLLSTESDANLERSGRFVPLLVDHHSRDGLSSKAQLQVASAACWNRAAFRGCIEILDRFRPDVVHAHKLYPQLSVAPVVAAFRRQVPIVQTIHDYEFISASPLDASGRRIDHDELRPTYRILNTVLHQSRRHVHMPRVRRWIAISNYVARVHARHGIQAEVIPHFVEAANMSGAERSGVLFAGRLSGDKGVRHLPDLARAVHPERVTLLGDGPLRGWLEREARGLDGRLVVKGRVGHEDVLAEMARSRLLVVPSLWPEPAGLVALEAMAAGTPVVAYSGGGIGEYVLGAGGGRIVAANASALASEVTRLLADHSAWAELSRGGVAGVRANFSASRHVDQLERMYANPREYGPARARLRAGIPR
jgi:glycosyltransferase involved in cell wall biosynthesis